MQVAKKQKRQFLEQWTFVLRHKQPRSRQPAIRCKPTGLRVHATLIKHFIVRKQATNNHANYTQSKHHKVWEPSQTFTACYSARFLFALLPFRTLPNDPPSMWLTNILGPSIVIWRGHVTRVRLRACNPN